MPDAILIVQGDDITCQRGNPVKGEKCPDGTWSARVAPKDGLTIWSVKITDNQNVNNIFIGYAKDKDASQSDPVWRIVNIIPVVEGTKEQIADFGNFSQIWNDRNSIFPGTPFFNLKSVQFDGANDFIDVTNNAIIDFDFRSEAFTLNMWLKNPNTTASVTYIEKQASNVGYRFQLTSNRLTIELRGTGGTSDRIRVRGIAGQGATINDGSWHMLTCTYDGSGNASGVNLYLDAVADTSLNIQNDGLVTDTSNSANMAIASRSGGGSNVGPGNIDEVSIHDVELSASEITTIYNLGKPIDLQGQGLSPISASLVYWNRMGDGPNDIFPILEDVESSISGTMANMTAGDIEGTVP